jgi:hypothetical protein
MSRKAPKKIATSLNNLTPESDRHLILSLRQRLISLAEQRYRLYVQSSAIGAQIEVCRRNKTLQASHSLCAAEFSVALLH